MKILKTGKLQAKTKEKAERLSENSQENSETRKNKHLLRKGSERLLCLEQNMRGDAQGKERNSGKWKKGEMRKEKEILNKGSVVSDELDKTK